MNLQKATMIAIAAKQKAADHMEGLALISAGVGMAGLDEYGFEFDGTAGIFKKVGKAVKKVAKTAVKVVKKVAAPVAAIALAPVTGGASVAAYGAIKAASIGKKAVRSQNQTAIALQNAQITGETIATPATNQPTRRKMRIPKDVSKASDAVAKDLVQSGQTGIDTNALIQQLMAQGSSGGGGGGGGGSPVYDSFAQSAEPAAAAGLPPWVMPVGIGVGVLGLVLLLKRK